jgi:hypothetical protein
MPTKKAPAGSEAAASKAKKGKGAAASGKAAPPGADGKKPNALQQPLQPSKSCPRWSGPSPCRAARW